MPKEIQLWRVRNGKLTPLSDGRLDLESRLEDWLETDIGVLGRPLLTIGRQVQTDHGGVIDLLCLDPAGDLVVVELKRDRTPRDVTAQLLDYGSWVAGLSAEDVVDLAGDFLPKEVSLESAFRDRFDEPLPEVLNESHQLLVIGSTVDPASERIIRYLSDAYGVSINAVTFQYFREPDGGQLVGRVHLLEPSEVESRARRKGSSKRRSSLSLEELEAAAEENGIGDLYRFAFETLQPLFNSTQTTRSHVRFAVPFEDRTGAVLNLIPTDGEPGALPFQIYTHRAHRRFGAGEAEIVDALPAGTQTWEYVSGEDPWWQGHAGVFRGHADVLTLKGVLQGPESSSHRRDELV